MNIEKFAFPTFIFFIFVKAFSGPIGMVVPLVNYSAVLIMLVLLIYKWIKSLLVIPSLMVMSFLFIFYIMLGTLNSGLIQTLFGVYIFIPFMFSVAYSGSIFDSLLKSSNKYFIFFAATSVIGVMYVSSFGAPWLGGIMDIGSYSKVVSRDWTAGGALRNPGFTAASFDVATLMLISFFFLLYKLRSKKRWISYALISLVPLYPIYLTTTKTTILTYIILVLVMLLPAFVAIAFSRISIVFSVFFSYFYMLPGQGQTRYDETNTFLQRMYETWPKAMGLLKDNYAYLIGKGIGGIGTPSLFFSPQNYNPADNALVYLYVISGSVSVVFVFLLLFKFLLSSFNDKYARTAYYLFAFCIFTGGVTYNLFESVFYSPFSGVLVGVIFNSRFCVMRKFNAVNSVRVKMQ